MRRFYGELVNKDGKAYSRSSTVSIRGAIQRHLTGAEFQRVINLVSGPNFKSANDVLSGALKEMKKEGLDHSKSYPPINDTDISLLYSTGTLSDMDPTRLQYKIFFELCLHFGRRGREGLRELNKDQLVFELDEVGVEYVTLCFNPSEKNHQGLAKRDTEHDQRLYGTGSIYCPLKSLKKYINLLHPSCNALFQKPKPNYATSAVWYCNSPVGQNTLAKFMSKISKKAGLKTIYSNHSIRATTVTTLRNAGVHVNDIMAVTGHKCAQSIMSYSKTAPAARRHMSHTLSVQTGYKVSTTTPKKKKSVVAAALGRDPNTPAIEFKASLSTPEKQTEISVQMSPGKVLKGSVVHVPKSVSFNMSEDVEIPCSQVVKRDNRSDGSRTVAVAKALFPNAQGCTFNMQGCTFHFSA